MMFFLTMISADTSSLAGQHPIYFIAPDNSTWVIRTVVCDDMPIFPVPWFHIPDEACPYGGLTVTEQQTIYVLKGQKPDDERVTVLHELMHVAVGVNHSNDQTTIHGAIYDISSHLAPILEKNPQLLCYFNQTSGLVCPSTK